MGTNVVGQDDVDVFIGVDVGESITQSPSTGTGKRLIGKTLPDDEAKLREVIGGLKSRGRVLFVVDQPATIGAPPLVVT